jgi:hypothetical protein
MVEIVLLVAILAVGASALYVAFAFRKYVTQKLDRALNTDLDPLARKADLDPLPRKADLDRLIREAVRGISWPAVAVGQDLRNQVQAAVSRQGEQVEALRDQLSGRLEKLDGQVGHLARTLDRQRELTAGPEKRAAGQESQGGDPREMDQLESALRQAEAYVAENGGWDQPPRLFSLATKAALIDADPGLATGLSGAAPDALIPVLQQELPPGEPFDVLATIGWPEDVTGCVLVTEIVMLPPEAEQDAPGDPAEADERTRTGSGRQRARLAVGVTRTGAYLCGLRREGAADLQVGPDMADDLVAALLGTL